MATKRKRIALAFPMGVQHLERVAYGIRNYALANTDWIFVTNPETHVLDPETLAGWDGDGVVAMVNTQKQIDVLRDLSCPVVNISGRYENTCFPRVRVDYAAAGIVAAEYLLKRGFRRFAFYGLKDVWYSSLYRDSFLQRIEADGRECSVYESISSMATGSPGLQNDGELERWLTGLEKPVGLVAAHDPRAAIVTRTCQELGINVPSEIAVLGINNDTTRCEFSHPTISSLDRNGEQIGQCVAELLESLIDGETAPDNDIVIAPLQVVERASTDVMAIENIDLARAIRFVHENVENPTTIDDISSHIGMSRRWLEYQFRDELQVSPHQYISKIRVERAKKLLESSERYKLKQVALMCGFTSSKQMNVVFERLTGQTPKLYRQELTPGS